LVEREKDTEAQMGAEKEDVTLLLFFFFFYVLLLHGMAWHGMV
jgi:hypothetical protein